MTDAETSRLDKLVGPFYDDTGLKACFGLGDSDLQRLVEAGDLLRVESGDGFNLYPSFQFDGDGALLPRLREMLDGLDPDRKNAWGDAIWLNAPEPDLGDVTPAAALRSSRADDAITLARQAGAFYLE